MGYPLVLLDAYIRNGMLSDIVRDARARALQTGRPDDAERYSHFLDQARDVVAHRRAA